MLLQYKKASLELFFQVRKLKSQLGQRFTFKKEIQLIIHHINILSTFIKIIMKSTKSQKKNQQKVIQDRTFGLKNKNKSKTVQNYVKGIANTVKNQGKSPAQLEAEYYEKKKLKKQKQQQAALLSALYADAKKLGGGGNSDSDDSDDDDDPANTVCPYFKQGLCQKGKKCIYSHDLTLDRNQEIDLYVDQRTQLIMNAIGGKQLNNLSEEQLGKILGQKQQEMMKGTRSKIVCKFFLQAVEKDKYGWKWNCPNGQTCKYKHCLPPGYVLKKDETGKAKVEANEISIEEKIDAQRNELMSQNKGSPLVTFEVFMKWKEERRIRKEKEAEQKKKELEKKKGKGVLKTGAELFKYDPTLFIDDAQAAEEYEKEEYVEQEEPEENKQEKGENEDQTNEQINEQEGEDDQKHQEN